MRNPYAGINFQTCERAYSFTHCHAKTQGNLNKVLDMGYNHLPISNYYPSQPFDPTGYTVPDDVIISPNAEHHNFSFGVPVEGTVHLCSVGSTFSSGSPSGQSPVGYGRGQWGDFVDEALAALKYADAGGITINHPTWTRQTVEFPDWQIADMLDYDDRILGIEILNAGATRNNVGYCIETWDNILKTGRKCWGFCTPDWYIDLNLGNKPGRSVLLVDEITEYKCLKAFRDGNFYGQEGLTDLAFDGISVSGQDVSVAAANATSITAVIDGARTEYQQTSVTVTVPESATYIRFEADSADDKIYSNAITFREGRDRMKPYGADDFLLLN